MLGKLLTLFTALFAGKGCSTDPTLTTVGPLTIEARDRRISSGAFPNLSGNPFSRMTVTEYRVLYDGKPVAVGEPKARTDRFWDALALTGAPRPTVLVGTRGAWLISEVHDEIVVETVVSPSSDILRWQWLDEAEGQPGPERSVTIRDSSTESRALDGGRLLLLGRSVVLDLDTLQFTHLRLSYATTVQELGGFNAGDEEVKILSPGRTQMVLVGSRTVDRMYEYALVMFEIATGRVYAVPFDSNALHFRSVWDATPEWIDHYFEWKRDPRGVERIEVVQPISALPWQGRLRHRHGGEVEYKLHPAGPGLTEPLRKLIETEFAAQRVAPTYGDPNDPDATSYDASGRRFRLWYNPELRNLSVFAERIDGFTTEGTPALIEEIGIRFNAILATGIHQQEFSSFLNHR